MTNYDEYSSVFPLRSNLCTHFILEVKSRLEEAKVNSPGQSDEGTAPWVGIRTEWYALYGQKLHTVNNILYSSTFCFCHLGGVFKIVKIRVII